MIKKYDSLVNINLDCIGIKDGGKITINGTKEQSANLKDKLSQIANKQNIENTGSLLGNDIISDHLAFTESYLPAIMVSQEYMDVIHTPEDSPDKVDGTPIKQAISIIYQFVKENHNQTFMSTFHNNK